MGVTVRQKTKGRGKPWWVFVAHNGKRASRKIGDKQAAETVASKFRAQIQLRDFGFEEDKPVPTFGEYADSWIETTVPATCKESTVRDYQDILRIHVRPVFENVKVTDVTRGKIKHFLLVKINEGYAKSTVSHLKDLVSGVLNKALDDEMIPANPALKLGKIIKRKDKKASINPLSADELRNLVDTVSERFPEHYTLFLLLARTGMRIGEALALKWEDIDFKGRYIRYSENI